MFALMNPTVFTKSTQSTNNQLHFVFNLKFILDFYLKYKDYVGRMLCGEQ